MSQGLQAVFLDNQEPLLRFLRARGATDQAEDLVQEVWIRAAASANGPIANPRAYLFRVANNLMIDHHRTDTQRVQREHHWSDTRGTSDAGVSDEPSVEQSLIARGMLEQAQTVIDDLGEPTTTIFRRFRIDGAAQKSIASELGISLATVEKHLQKAYRAMLALKKEFDTE
jgi:RNA polymerase sigma factor (sigma-70 family)